MLYVNKINFISHFTPHYNRSRMCTHMLFVRPDLRQTYVQSI